MTAPTKTWTERHEEYWIAEGRQKAAFQLAGTCWFVLICQFVFIGLDRWVFPDVFALFVSMRLILNLAIVGVLLRWRHSHPNECQIAVPAAVAIEILAMIFASGESDSLYFAGLILVLVGIPVLQPISMKGSIAVSSICLGGFVLCATFVPRAVDEKTIVVEIIFVLAAALESAVSCRALEVNRVVAFEQRCEIENTRDQLASLDEAKTRFSENVHHELRTPLTLILAPLETLRGGDLGDLPHPVRRMLETMHANGQRLLKLINNLLDLAKLESDRFTICRYQTDLYLLLEEIVDRANPMASRKGIALTMKPRVGPSFAFLDSDAVEKIVANLVSNALKFTKTGGTVELGVDQSGEEPGLTLWVRDTGVGLAESDLDQIFNRFSQVDGSATREHEGTGIGLSIVKELVELHGGQVWAESEGIGHGSKFVIQFPIGDPDKSPPREETTRSARYPLRNIHEPHGDITDEPEVRLAGSDENGDATNFEHYTNPPESNQTSPPGADISGISSEKQKIVVVDDNAEMRDLLKFILDREFEVYLANNGKTALKQIEDVNPDLVITDIMMPEMTGIELCQALKTSPSTASTPIMIVSSKAEDEMKIKGLELGADDYVTKPFHPKELLARARGLVRLRVLQREVEQRNEAIEAAMLEIKTAEVQLVRSERLAAIGEIAAGVAHEVNNPVNYALNAVRALRVEVTELCQVAENMAALDWDGIDSHPSQLRTLHRQVDEIRINETAANLEELGRIIADGLERTHRLVRDLLVFASPDRDEQGEVDIGDCIRSTVALLRQAISDARVDLELNIPIDLPLVRGDAGALNQIILNLVKNALQAMEGPSGKVQVEVEAHSDHIDIRVIDDGPGIEPDLQDRIFEPFFSTKDAGMGTGLGLSISRQIAESHGGQLALYSKLGEGATFTLSFPTAESVNHNTQPIADV